METKGYKRNQNIRAAPYDFRLSPISNKKYIEDKIKLIENMFNEK